MARYHFFMICNLLSSHFTTEKLHKAGTMHDASTSEKDPRDHVFWGSSW
jgi:hypothetical protein